MSRARRLIKAASEYIPDAIETPLLKAFGVELSRAPRPRQKPKVRTDNPGGEWLEHERRRADERVRSGGTKVSGAVTGYLKKPIELDPRKLEVIPGARNERRVPGEFQYDQLRPSMEEKGFLPDSPILVGINHRGEPYIIEGNTRAAVARDIGIDRIPAEVRYFAGGEGVEGRMMPSRLEEYMPPSELSLDPNFQQYFGGSQAVDKYGEPLRLYTGTSKDMDFNAFRVPRNGMWFAKDPKEASEYAMQNDSMDFRPDPDGPRSWSLKQINTASRVMPAYLSAQNPIRFPEPKLMHDEIYDMTGDNYKRGQGLLFDKFRAKGYDSVILGDDEVFVALRDPTQIKSAIGNQGTYSVKDKKMNKARGGLAVKPNKFAVKRKSKTRNKTR